MRLVSKHAQSILEYCVLLCLILSALLIMQFYVKRCYQGRLKQEAEQVGQQYSPGHTTSSIITSANTTTESYTGGKTDSDGLAKKEVEVPDGMTVTFADNITTVTKRETVDAFAREGD